MPMNQSKEFFKNMKASDIPIWNSRLSFEEQNNDVQQFWSEEGRKIVEGITVNGVFISPWLYWHCNFFNIQKDMPDGSRVPGTPDLRDNEWMFAENYQRAKREKKGLGMFGTRRGAKALWDNEVVITNHGFKKIGDIMPGEYIYDNSGKITRVIDVCPQGVKTIYQVIFEDGRSVCCCADHEWTILKNGKSPHTRTLGSIMADGDINRFSIPLTEPVEFGQKYPAIVNPAEMAYITAGFFINGYDFPEQLKLDFQNHEFAPIRNRDIFADTFIKYCNGIVNGYSEFDIKYYDKDVFDFVSRIFRSLGYYFKKEGNSLTISNTKKDVAIKEVRVKGNNLATCIVVENSTGLFLTTDYVVTHNSVMLASSLGHNATISTGLDHNIIGFSETDLQQIGMYLGYALDNVPEFFRYTRPKDDWSKGVKMGWRNNDNSFFLKAKITISNVDMGKRSSTQKTAGSTPYSWVFDEFGKGDPRGPWGAAMPAFDTPFGWRVVPILSGTSGELSFSRFAEEILSNPVANNLIVADWSILDKKCKNPTWKKKTWSIFIPGQMSHSKYGIKNPEPLGNYLGVSGADINKITILATDFEESTRLMKEKLKAVEKNRRDYNEFKMFYPLCIEDCFLDESINMFPVQRIIQLKNELKELDQEGVRYDLTLGAGSIITFSSSDKELAEYPHKGGLFDAPVLVFEHPEECDFRDFVYVCGLDFYKQDVSSGESLGAFYVFKRYVKINDPYANQIVASYVARPSDMNIFCRNCEYLQMAYHAVCLQENVDTGYQIYLRHKQKEYAYLANGEEVVGKMIRPGISQNNKLGLSTIGANKDLLMNTLIAYLWESITVGYDANGDPIKDLGVTRVKDIELLNELASYKSNGNFDRIWAFAHALVYAKYLDSIHVMPASREQKDEEALIVKKRNMQSIMQDPYGVRFQHNPYGKMGHPFKKNIDF